MIRNISKAALLAAAVITVGTAFVNCSKKHSDDDIGSLQLALTLSPGVTINTVRYTISGNGIAPINGNIDVSMSNTANATAFVSGLPVGNNYLVVMSADSTDNMTHCTGQANFNVLLGQTAMANVTLQCRGPQQNVGQVAINGRLDNCPYVTALSADRLQATVGQSITVNVAATDLDPSDTITYAWTAAPATGVGTLGTPAAATTTFTCTGAGTAQLSIVISDGVCGETRMNAIPLSCVAGGATGAGGGTAGTGGGTAGTGGGTAGTGGSAAGTGGGTAGTGGGTAGTGGGAAGTGGGTAGTGGGTAGTGGSAPPMCMEGSNGAACATCTTDNCSLGPTGSDGCCGLADPNDVMLCQTLFACIQQNAATCTSGGDATNCFCGTSGGTCFTTAGSANGPCAQQYIAASKTTDPIQIQARFVSPNFPSGRAGNLSACQGALCPECAIP